MTTTGYAVSLFRLLRPHQWAKNLLIFLPLLTAHRLGDQRTLTSAVVAFLAFCLVASSGYVINDSLDLDHDRRHGTKRRRPFASGALPLRWRFWLVPALLGGAVVLALTLPVGFRIALAAYFILTTLYSVWLKRLVLVDVLVISAMYTMRVFGGGQAAAIELSNWFLAFSMFLFLSMALAKRVCELRRHTSGPGDSAAGRNYRASDLAVLGRMGLSSGHLAVLVLALYINSVDVHQYYRQPEWLWLLCGLLYLWISRIWLVTERGDMHDDPVIFVLGDAASYGIAASAALVLYTAT